MLYIKIKITICSPGFDGLRTCPVSVWTEIGTMEFTEYVLKFKSQNKNEQFKNVIKLFRGQNLFEYCEKDAPTGRNLAR